VLVLMLWWVTEDFDFPVHQAAIAGLCLGLFWGALAMTGGGLRPAATTGR
jgi:hypothetical protein